MIQQEMCVWSLHHQQNMWQLRKEILSPHAANASHRTICSEVTVVLEELSLTVQSPL